MRELMSPQQWPLPENDPWSTPFAQVLLEQLELFPGATVLDVAAGGGIPAFYIAEQVGPHGQVLAVDINPQQVMRAQSIQGGMLPWLRFEIGDIRQLSPSLSRFDRITGNLSFMFFRPSRFEVLQNLVRFLESGGQIVLTFPSLGTFETLWNRVDQEMRKRSLEKERRALAEYIEERPSGDQCRQWLDNLKMEKISVIERPLVVISGPGREFLEHPLLRRGFLDDVYECFEDSGLAEEFMTHLSEDLSSFTPLKALRCAISAWKP